MLDIQLMKVVLAIITSKELPGASASGVNRETLFRINPFELSVSGTYGGRARARAPSEN